MTDSRDASRRRRVLSELDANALNALQARPLPKSAPSPSRKPEPKYEPETGDRAEVGVSIFEELLIDALRWPGDVTEPMHLVLGARRRRNNPATEEGPHTPVRGLPTPSDQTLMPSPASSKSPTTPRTLASPPPGLGFDWSLWLDQDMTKSPVRATSPGLLVPAEPIYSMPPPFEVERSQRELAFLHMRINHRYLQAKAAHDAAVTWQLSEQLHMQSRRWQHAYALQQQRRYLREQQVRASDSRTQTQQTASTQSQADELEQQHTSPHAEASEALAIPCESKHDETEQSEAGRSEAQAEEQDIALLQSYQPMQELLQTCSLTEEEQCKLQETDHKASASIDHDWRAPVKATLGDFMPE